MVEAKMPAETYRRRLWEVALDQYGYVSTADADALGVPAVELRKLAGRGMLENVARGLYRFPDAPTTGRDAFMEAVLWVGPDAALSHDAVLALHDLASANPRTLRVVTPHRVRKTRPRPDVTIIHRKLPATDLTAYFKIPSTTVARALMDCRGLIMTDRLLAAADEAFRQGLLLRRERDEVVGVLRGAR
jgi:predicted transcriptional regulator of viral defense system